MWRGRIIAKTGDGVDQMKFVNIYALYIIDFHPVELFHRCIVFRDLEIMFASLPLEGKELKFDFVAPGNFFIVLFSTAK